ncbi:MAG: N-6 DNA methylase [Syntrophobacterales bacterium]|nr:N-6 DNA methylase [Syntrophobacterales bacterium]
MSAPEEIHELIERFDRNLDTYRSGRYNEAQVRQEFINPFFHALGWDVYNRQGYAEAYKDVIHEDAIKVGSAVKAPDYCFRIGGTRKFFLEAKKPSVNIKEDIHPAYQLRRYAWSAKLPLSILTDFEELAVYDCRIKPVKTDKSSTARTLYFTYNEYVDRWDEIASIFSREAVLKGSFDKYVESSRAKRGTAEVDTAFLEEIERWRETLARNIALRNPGLTIRELNFAVQRTIDRIIFLRICEDRGIEQYGRLMSLRNGTQAYQRLCQLFQQADDRYNSGLFHFRKEKDRTSSPDDLTLDLAIDDKILRDIFTNLYYPDSPYEFSVLPADILGQVYEQFLGKVIRLTSGHRAVVEEKPEVKKAGGVYYTPTYIVGYIVKQTVGKLVENKKPGPRGAVSRLKILDPACGSGSFLIGAYQYLLDWHRDQYITDDPEKWAKGRKPCLYQGPGGDWRLTTDERKRILLNNIYGVDIDAQAVEVTKLSLLLKVLEDESAETIGKTLELFQERALPDLGNNIKCGNSLIGPDFYEGQQTSFLDEEEMYRVNVFDWETEFKEIMQGGGFDAVIGNPPWGAEFQESNKPYLRKNYDLNTGKYESYIFFIEKSSSLLKSNGFWGYIVPSYWVSRSQTENLRQHLCKKMVPQSFIILPENVFTGVKMDSCIVVTQKARMTLKESRIVVTGEIGASQLSDCFSPGGLEGLTHTIDLQEWTGHSRFRFNPRISQDDARLIVKTETGTFILGSIVEISQGLTLYRRSTLAKQYGKTRAEEIVSKRLFHSDHKKDHTFKKELLGRDVARYNTHWNGHCWVSYGPWLAHAVDERFFQGPRLVVQKLRNPTLKQRLVVSHLDDDETYSAGVLLNIIPLESQYSLLYVLGLLNSHLINWWYRKSIVDVSIRVVDLKQLPIRTIDFSDPTEKARHNRMVELVERMLDLNKQLAKAKVPQTKTVLQRQVETTDRQIDRLIYELYELTEEEIKIVEGS